MAKIKRICFFSVGFAFNRLVRMRYYEKIFPKDVEIFLITTNKYENTSEMKYQDKWNLKKTKVITLDYNPFKIPFQIRRFCNKNKIDAVSNLGHPFGAIPLIFAGILNNPKVFLYYLGDSIDYPKIDTFTKKGIKNLFILIPYWFLSKLSDKIATVGYNTYKKCPLFFMSSKKKFYYIHAPINPNLFKDINQKTARKKLGISLKKKLIVFVGKVTKRKGGKLLSQVIKSNQDIKFIVIGKWKEDEIPKFKSKNLTYIEKILNENLNNYYSAADLVFGYHKQGCQMGIVPGEALLSGTPVLHTKRIAFPDSPVLIKLSDNLKEFNQKIKEFFSLSEKEKNRIRKQAREYAIKYLSDEVWKEKYLRFYLN